MMQYSTTSDLRRQRTQNTGQNDRWKTVRIDSNCETGGYGPQE